MATVTISLTLEQQLQTFEGGGGFYQGVIPFGEVVLTQTAGAIALKGAPDTNVTTVTGTLPAGFVYRMVELRSMLNAPSEADLDEVSAGMGVTFTENQQSFKETIIYNKTHDNANNSGLGGIPIRNPATTNDFATIFNPDGADKIYSDVIDASQGLSVIQLVLVDDSGNAHNAMTLSTYIRFLQYTIAQYRSGDMWVTNPSVS